MKTSTAIALCVGMGLMLLIAGGYYYTKRSEPTSAERHLDESRRFVYARGNLSFVPSPGWSLVEGAIAIPKGLEGPDFAFRREEGSCALIYAHIPWDPSKPSERPQVSFGERVKTQDGQDINSDWRVHRDDAPEGLTFQDHTRTPLPHEMRTAFYWPGATAASIAYLFVLYNPDGGTVAEVCDSEFSNMLASIKAEFETTMLTAKSRGDLLVTTDDGIFLSFVDEDKILRRVRPLSPISLPPTPAVYDNSLYFAQGGVLVRLDPFKNEVAEVPGTEISGGAQINEFYIVDTRLFYLAGALCEGKRCDLTLYEVPLSGGAPKQLAEDISSRAILGYDRAEDALYLAETWGDAGCFSYDIYRYRFAQSAVEKTASYGGCEGDEGTAAQRAGFDALLNRFAAQNARAEFARVEHGTLTYPGQHGLNIRDTYAMRFFLE